MNRLLVLLCVTAVTISGCGYFSNQGHTVRKSYGAAERGREVYDAKQSLALAKELNDHQSAVFAARTRTVATLGDPAAVGKAAMGQLASQPAAAATSAPGVQPPTLGAPTSVIPPLGAPVTTTAPGTDGRPAFYYYRLDKFWPDAPVGALIGKTDAASASALGRELNNLFTQQYIRDLVTEPSIHSLVPTYREVKLSCAPPPEQAAIATAASVAAQVEAKGGKGGIDARLAESITRLFEQTERTVFLQYALFRLCEMSINSAGEFRNVFPLIVHELVRQSASLTLEANIEVEKAKRAAAEAEMTRAQALKEALQAEGKRLDCAKRERDKGTSAEETERLCGVAPKTSPVAAVEGPQAPAAPRQP
jgi:hypothetical protein